MRITDSGKSLILAEQVAGRTVTIDRMIVGGMSNDDYSLPENELYNGSETMLKAEVPESGLQHFSIYGDDIENEINSEDDSIIEYKGIFEPDVKGWHIREVGLYAGETLIAVGKLPEVFVPENEVNKIVSDYITCAFEIENAAGIFTIVTQNAQLASKEYVLDQSAEIFLNILENTQEIGLIRNKLAGG